jgi:hypothetical protein
VAECGKSASGSSLLRFTFRVPFLNHNKTLSFSGSRTLKKTAGQNVKRPCFLSNEPGTGIRHFNYALAFFEISAQKRHL